MIQRYHYDEYMKKIRDLEGGEFILFSDHEQAMTEKDEQIAILKNVLLSDEGQIKNLVKRNAEMRDDCIKTARDRDIANAALAAAVTRQSEQIAALKAELKSLGERWGQGMDDRKEAPGYLLAKGMKETDRA